MVGMDPFGILFALGLALIIRGSTTGPRCRFNAPTSTGAVCSSFERTPAIKSLRRWPLHRNVPLARLFLRDRGSAGLDAWIHLHCCGHRLCAGSSSTLVHVDMSNELGPCPRCGKPTGEFKDGGSGRFRYLVICGACSWSPGPARFRDAAVKLWNEPKPVEKPRSPSPGKGNKRS